MKSDIQNYVKLQTALINEKAKIEARLTAINKVLGGDVSVVASAPVTTATRGGRRTFSAATKAKMAAAQKARWAKKKGTAAAPATAPASTPIPKKKRKMSAAGKANIRAAVKARWAKVNAAKAKATKADSM